MNKKTFFFSLILFSSFANLFFSAKSHAVDFTPDEKKWLNQELHLKFSEVEWQPLSYTTDYPVYRGIIADYLKILRRHSGIKMEFVKSNTWNEVLKKFSRNKIDLIPALAKEDDVGAEVVLTEPYISFPLVIAARPDTIFIGYTKELEGKKVGVGKGYTSYNFLKKNYPKIKIITTDNVLQGLRLLEKGEIDAFVGHMAVITDTILHSNLDLSIAGKTEYVFKHRMGVSPKHAWLVPIFNKIFAEITPEEHNRIYNKWIKINIKKTDYSIVWKISIVMIIVILGFIYWNRKLSAEKERTQRLLDDLSILKAKLEEKNDELKKLAVTDQLTGLYNRFMLDSVFESEFNRATRYNYSFGIILIDIDFFKVINDTYGHQTGDRTLVCIAELLISNIRKTDVIGRWGGEEFLIISPEIDKEGIMNLADKLRVIIANYDFPEIHSKTASFGVTLYRQHDNDNITEITKRADEALYSAKEKGRNRVVFK